MKAVHTFLQDIALSWFSTTKVVSIRANFIFRCTYVMPRKIVAFIYFEHFTAKLRPTKIAL
jgi:hypothetical protein